MEQLTRVDKQRLMKEGEPTIDPEIYEPPLKLPPKRRGGVDVNEVMAKTLEDDGVASRVYGQLFDNKRPEVAGQSLSRVMGNKLDNKRLGIIIEAVLLGMGDASKPIVREVCPRGKKERRRDSRPNHKSFLLS